jgi:hypothetical protein
MAVAWSSVASAGPVFLDCGDRDDHGFFSGGQNQAGWKLIEQALNFLNTNATNGGSGVLVIGATGGDALAAVTSATTALGLSQTVVTGAAISTVNFSAFRILYVPSDDLNTPGGITDADNTLLTARKADIQAFVNGGGGLLMLTQAGLSAPYSSLELPLPFQVDVENFTGSSTNLHQTPELAAAGFNITDQELSNGTPVHCDFLGPPGFNGLKVLVLNDADEIITLGGGSRTVLGVTVTGAPLLNTSTLAGLSLALAVLGLRTLAARRRLN